MPERTACCRGVRGCVFLVSEFWPFILDTRELTMPLSSHISPHTIARRLAEPVIISHIAEQNLIHLIGAKGLGVVDLYKLRSP